MKRPAIPTAIKRAAWAKNDGFCMHEGCTVPGDILEHIQPWAFAQKHELENLEPRCIDHAKEKTRGDIKAIARSNRLSGKTGQAKRRAARKAAGQKPLLQSGAKIPPRAWPEKPAGFRAWRGRSA